MILSIIFMWLFIYLLIIFHITVVLSLIIASIFFLLILIFVFYINFLWDVLSSLSSMLHKIIISLYHPIINYNILAMYIVLKFESVICFLPIEILLLRSSYVPLNKFCLFVSFSLKSIIKWLKIKYHSFNWHINRDWL